MSIGAIPETQLNVVSLSENKYIIELFAILYKNGKETEGLSTLIDHVSSMEHFVQQAQSNITEMKTQLDTMKEMQARPTKSTLQKSINFLETKVGDIKVQIANLKNGIISGCRGILTAFKNNGIIALDQTTSFFHLKDSLRAIKNGTIHGVDSCESAIVKIQTFSKEYHTAGRAIKNMIRMFLGKDPLDTVKEYGKLTNIASSPYRAEKACFIGIQHHADKMISSIQSLEQNANTKRAERSANLQEPTLMKRLEDGKNKATKIEILKPTIPLKTKGNNL